MRCDAHGLAAAPDGLCVVCRREQRAERPPRVTGAPSSGAPTRSLPRAIIAGGAVACMALIAWHVVRRAILLPQPDGSTAAVLSAARPPAPDDVESRGTIE